MKVLAIPGDAGACAHYRINEPYWKASAANPDILVAFTHDEEDPNFEKADVLVIPRVHTDMALDVVKKFLASKRPVILDFDDNFHAIPWYNPAHAIFAEGTESRDRFEEALQLATVVTTSTPRLAEAYRHLRDDLVVCPNFVTQEHYDTVTRLEPKPSPHRQNGQLRLGYVGSHTHFGDVGVLARPLTEVLADYPNIRIVFFGYPPILPLQHRIEAEYYPGIQCMANESVSAFMLRYYKEIKAMDLDIALAPLEDNLFNKCKSNIKLLEYGMAGVPIVASWVGPYKDDYRLGDYYCADDRFEWDAHLRALIENCNSERSFLANNMRNRIKEEYTTEASIRPWVEMLRRLERG